MRLNQLDKAAAASDPEKEENGHTGGERTQLISAEVTVIGKPVRERDRDHLRFVASQGCLICGRSPSDAHHLKFAEARAMGRKVSDKFTVPLCRLHHRELHRGNERAWWQRQGLDPLPIAAMLWARTHRVVALAETAKDDRRPDSIKPMGQHPGNGSNTPPGR